MRLADVDLEVGDRLGMLGVVHERPQTQCPVHPVDHRTSAASFPPTSARSVLVGRRDFGIGLERRRRRRAVSSRARRLQRDEPRPRRDASAECPMALAWCPPQRHEARRQLVCATRPACGTPDAAMPETGPIEVGAGRADRFGGNVVEDHRARLCPVHTPGGPVGELPTHTRGVECDGEQSASP